MKPYARSERGATLVIAIIMLFVVTLLVSGSFALSTVNLRAAANMQVRQGVLASANAAVAQVVSSPFTNDPAAAATDLEFDINNNGSKDYTVAISVPECIRAIQYTNGALSSSSLSIPSTTWNTVWLIQAAVHDAATGARTVVRSAVRVLLREDEKNRVCP